MVRSFFMFSLAFYGVNVAAGAGRRGERNIMLYYMQFYMYNYSPSRMNFELISRVADIELVHINRNC